MKIAILDDYLDTARGAADWGSLGADATITVFDKPLPADVDQRAAALAGFDVIVAMRERTPFPADLLSRLPALRLLASVVSRRKGDCA